MNRISTWIAVFVAAVIAAIVARAYFTGGTNGGVQGPAMLAGHPAPSFPVDDINGRQRSLAAYSGHIVIVNLWATWCPPCRAEMPDLERLYRAYQLHGLIVLGIDQGESAATASAFAHSLGITYPLLIDKDQQYGRVYAALGLPTSVIIDRDGVVVHGYDGVLTYEQMRKAIAPLFPAHFGTVQ